MTSEISSKPEAFQDPAYVPRNGAEWEAWIWYHLESHPNLTSKQLAEAHPHLSLGAASGYLSKLATRKQIVGVKFSPKVGEPEVTHYSISVKDFVPTTRQRNKQSKASLPPFNFDAAKNEETLITSTALASQCRGPKTPGQQLKAALDSMPVLNVKGTDTGRFRSVSRPDTQNANDWNKSNTPKAIDPRDFTARAKDLIAAMPAPLAKAVYIELQDLFWGTGIPTLQNGPATPPRASGSGIDVFSTRTRNCLAAQDLYSLEEIAALTGAQLLRGPNFGPTMLNEVKAVLADHNLRLRGGT